MSDRAELDLALELLQLSLCQPLPSQPVARFSLTGCRVSPELPLGTAEVGHASTQGSRRDLPGGVIPWVGIGKHGRIGQLSLQGGGRCGRPPPAAPQKTNIHGPSSADKQKAGKPRASGHGLGADPLAQAWRPYQDATSSLAASGLLSLAGGTVDAAHAVTCA